MRQFKQMFLSLKLWQTNKHADGIKLEKKHWDGKNKQTKHENFKKKFKNSVMDDAANQLKMKFACNGGRWGCFLQCSLGRSCLRLHCPKNPQQPNKAIKPFLIPKTVQPQPKIHPTRFIRKNARPSVHTLIESHGKLNELLLLVNAVVHWTQHSFTWSHIKSSRFWDIRKIRNFRFHGSKSSFAIDLTTDKCIVKMNSNHVFQFQHAYRVQHDRMDDVIIGFGTFWAIKPSANPNTWVNDKFSSMDYINKQEATTGWCYLTNILEPVFLLHNCVSFGSVQKMYGAEWKDKNKHDFHKDYAFNMHKLIEYRNNNRQIKNKSQLPCGPVFKCKLHSKIKCRRCVEIADVFTPDKWIMKWICNENHHPHFWVFDQKNGLCMTLMKTVTKSKDYTF